MGGLNMTDPWPVSRYPNIRRTTVGVEREKHMSEMHFESLQEALQYASDRIDIALARTIQLEAITDAHHAFLSAVAATHPDPAALREEWRRISSMIVASSQIRPPDDAAMEIRAEQTEAQVRMISEILDSLASESEE